MSSTIQIRVDDELKMKSDQLFKDLGTDTTTAIRMFLTQAVANHKSAEVVVSELRGKYGL